MDRRSFLAKAAVAGALGTGALSSGGLAAGCGGAAVSSGDPERGALLGARESAELLARLDRGLGLVRGWAPGRLAQQMPGHPQPERAEGVLRLTIESLLITDVTRAIPRRSRPAGELARRLREELAVVDRGFGVHHALLRGMPRSAKRSLDRKLREQPSFPMEVAEWIDEHASKLGVSRGGRVALRQAAHRSAVRMRRQSSNAVIEDALGKVDRAVARHGVGVAHARARTTQALVAAIWQQVEAAPVPTAAGPGVTPGPAPAPAVQAVPIVQQPDLDQEWVRFIRPDWRPRWSARWAGPGDEEIRIGGIMMPFGLLSCGLLLIIGLIVVIAGAVQNADWDGRTRGLD